LKITIEFDGYEEREDLNDALKGGEYKSKLDEIWQELFRPRHKHGYSDSDINNLLGLHVSEEEMQATHIACNALMDAIEKIYQRVVSEE